MTASYRTGMTHIYIYIVFTCCFVVVVFIPNNYSKNIPKRTYTQISYWSMLDCTKSRIFTWFRWNEFLLLKLIT